MMTLQDMELTRYYHSQGLSDIEIGKILHLSHSGVKYRRDKLGLLPNKQKGWQPQKGRKECADNGVD